MSQYPTGGGEAVTTYTQEHRDRLAAAPVPPMPHATEYVTYQSLAPYAIGLLRAIYLGVFGAAGGLSIGLAMGSRDWSDLLWGALIGFLGGFLGRTAEAVVIDTPKANSVTEKVQS